MQRGILGTLLCSRSMTSNLNRRPDTPKRQDLRNGMPNAEVILWETLRRRPMEGVKFRRQYGVDRFVLDFYCVELKLAIEVDGPSHDTVEAQTYDQARQVHIEGFGIQFLQFQNWQVYQELDGVVEVIRQRVIALKKVKADEL
jgi:very-short-patch-repair endonuclease